LWSYSRASRCDSQECVFGYSAAVTATNDVVVAGSMDGYLEIISATTGERVWSHDAFREYPSVNGVASHGGAFAAHGPMIADDLLIVSAGYAYVGEQRAGNALLVFQLEPEHE
jgi:polyvinyl alcohol dehydrogenase (cytochrome)